MLTPNNLPFYRQRMILNDIFFNQYIVTIKLINEVYKGLPQGCSENHVRDKHTLFKDDDDDYYYY